jgi:uncharacterized damage-inducible protein DinB
MTPIENQVIETWRIHNRITSFVIEHIPDEALKATLSKRGGRDIGRQFAHMNAIRIWQLEPMAKRLSMPLTSFPKDESPEKKFLLDAFEQSGLVMEKYLEQCITKEGKATNFKTGVIAMLVYYISHEAHHRGNILLTMKQCGFKIPDELKWGIWDMMRK